VTSTDTKPEVVFSRRGRHLEKWIWRHIFAVGASIWTKFGSLMQKNVQISGKWSKSKPKVDFQYGRRLFFKNRSSYISVINWDMSTKFGLLIYFDLLKVAISINAKPEIVLSGRGRHLDKAIWRPNRSNTISGFAFVDIAAFRRSKSISKPNFVEISQMEAKIYIFMAIQNGLGRGQNFFQNQECVNILGCSVTLFEHKNVLLMLVDDVCTIQALLVTKPLH